MVPSFSHLHCDVSFTLPNHMNFFLLLGLHLLSQNFLTLLHIRIVSAVQCETPPNLFSVVTLSRNVHTSDIVFPLNTLRFIIAIANEYQKGSFQAVSLYVLWLMTTFFMFLAMYVAAHGSILFWLKLVLSEIPC